MAWLYCPGGDVFARHTCFPLRFPAPARGKLLKDMFATKESRDSGPVKYRLTKRREHELFAHIEKLRVTSDRAESLNMLQKLADYCGGALDGLRPEAESKRAAERINFHASILYQVPIAVIATNPRGKIIYLNEFAETLYCCKTEEAIGNHIDEILIPREGKALARRIRAKISRSGSWEGEFEVLRKNGSLFVARVSQAAMRDGRGNTIGYLGVSQDATESRRSQERLRESDRRFATFMENLPGFAWIKDVEGRYLFLSPPTARLSLLG